VDARVGVGDGDGDDDDDDDDDDDGCSWCGLGSVGRELGVVVVVVIVDEYMTYDDLR